VKGNDGDLSQNWNPEGFTEESCPREDHQGIQDLQEIRLFQGQSNPGHQEESDGLKGHNRKEEE